MEKVVLYKMENGKKKSKTYTTDFYQGVAESLHNGMVQVYTVV